MRKDETIDTKVSLVSAQPSERQIEDRSITCIICNETQKIQKRCHSCGFAFLSLEEPKLKIIEWKILPLLPDETKCRLCGADDPRNLCPMCNLKMCADRNCFQISKWDWSCCRRCKAEGDLKRAKIRAEQKYEVEKKKFNYLLHFTRDKRKVTYQSLLNYSQIPVELVDAIWGYHSDVHVVSVKKEIFERPRYHVIYQTSTGADFEWKPQDYGNFYRKDLQEGIEAFLGGEVIILLEGKELEDDKVLCHHERVYLEGRPFLNEVNSYSRAKTLKKPASSDWSFYPSTSISSSPSFDPSHKIYKWLSKQWLSDGLCEHASIGSFARHLLELLAVGAPSALIAEVQRAAGDEIIHTQLCFRLASLYSGSPVEPGAFPISSSQVVVRTDVTSLATGTAIEGCVEETCSAVCAYVIYNSYIDLDEKERASYLHDTLKTLSQDEIRHAALAWKTLIWACEKGGTVTREAVRDAFSKRFAKEDSEDSKEEAAIEFSKLISFGRLPKSMQHTVVALTLELLIKPWSQIILNGDCIQIKDLQKSSDLTESSTKERNFVLSAGTSILSS